MPVWTVTEEWEGRPVTLRWIVPVRRLDDAIVELRYCDASDLNTHDALWARCRARRDTTCAITGKPITTGELLYRPVGIMRYRDQRVRADVVDSALKRNVSRERAPAGGRGSE